MNRNHPSHMLLFVALSLALLGSTAGHALANAPTVEGKYVQNNKREVVLVLTIGNPAPASLIIRQPLPPTIEITEAKPSPSKYSAAKGFAKWLLKDLQPGPLRIHFSVDKPLPAKFAHCLVRFRDPVSGKRRELTLRAD